MNIASAIRDHLQKAFNSSALLHDLSRGTLPRDRLPQLALAHHAEIRTFINIKLPARLYLCPDDAMVARRYFWHLYEEENQHFGSGGNHADLFLPVCYELGLTDAELTDFYAGYSRPWLSLFQDEPSRDNIVRELAISYAWESVSPHFGPALVENARHHYGFSEEALRYFRLHSDVDAEHMKDAETALLTYCTSAHELAIASSAIWGTIVTNLYLDRAITRQS